MAVDIRRGSPTYGKHVARVISAADWNQFLVPAGFAHGFCVISEVADVVYGCSTYYDPELEGGFAFDDPDVPGVTCYMSHARTGGIKGAIGLAEDPGEASIACRQVGPIDVGKLDKLKGPHEVFSERASLIFKSTQVTRFWDAKRRALVYLVYTDRIIEGSPRNSISVVPVGAR